jgi:hypothetical protein
MLRIAALLIVIGGCLAAGPAAAQFGNLFGNSPPRPPADIPNGGQPSSPDYPGQAPPTYPAYPAPAPGPQAYPGQPAPAYSGPAPAYPGQSAPAYPPAPPPPSPAVEEQALPPPPGAAAPGQAYPPQPADRGYPPSQGQAPSQGALAPPQGNSQAAPAAAEAAPDNDTVVEKPTEHIANKRAVFVGLDKITGRTIKFDAALGETVQFGALQVTPRTCYTRPPTEATNTDAFVEVDEVTLKGDIKRIFTGWMFASSPGLNAVEHPIYDVWLINCASPIETTLAQPAEQSAASPVAPTRHPAVRRRTPPARDEVEPQPD